MKRYIKSTWEVYGEYGGTFSRLDDAKKCAQFASTTSEYDFRSSVWKDGSCYIDYENGKLVRDGWTLPSLKRTGKKAKFNINGKIVEHSIYLNSEGQEVIKHEGKVYRVSTGH